MNPFWGAFLFIYSGPDDFVLQPTQLLESNEGDNQTSTSVERETEQMHKRFTLDFGTPGITRRLGQRRDR